MNYYLINNEIKKGIEMPKRDNYGLTSAFESSYNHWLSSLQPCSITESELEKVKDYFKNIDFWDESKIADITELIRVVNESYTHNGNILGKCSKIYFKQQEETNEAVEFAEWLRVECNCFDSSPQWYYLNDGENSPKTSNELYEIFKSKKFKN